MDEIDMDKASEETLNFIGYSVKNMQKSMSNKLIPNGTCYNCFEIIDDEKLFCNNICAEQYEITKRLEDKYRKR